MSDNEKRHPDAVNAVPDPGELKKLAAAASPRLRLLPECEAGKLRVLHGVSNHIPLRDVGMADATTALREKVLALKIPYSYFHDTPYENYGMDLIDISRVFPIFSADPDDPKNYRFTENDDYLRQVIEAGTKVIYRLGESIVVGGKVKYRVHPPTDYDKWASICINIARHYNEGWGNGFEWDIRDWAVWEEPNNPNLWSGTFDQYLQLYATTARAFKARFPHLNIGGPSTTTLGIKFLERFLDFCRDEKLPLDFVTYTAYYRTPDELFSESRVRRSMLDDRGFSAVPLYINEWHASPDWNSYADPVGIHREVARISGADGAAFAAATLCGLQDSPIDKACFYTMAMGCGWGMFDSFHQPTPTYYVFEKFCSLFGRSRRRVATETADSGANFYALASRHDHGIDLLVANYDRIAKTVKIEIPSGFEVATVEILDEEFPHFAPVASHRRKLDGSVLELKKAESPAAFWIEFKPVK